MFYLIYIIYFFKCLTPGERLFTIVWAWHTRKEMNGGWLSHMETAIERAHETAEAAFV